MREHQYDKVSGMLLYAKTDENVYPNQEYKMSGNRIAVRTLDLDKDFESIKNQLDEIAEKYRIMNIPTLIFFRNGEVVDRTVGLMPKADLVEKINSLL